MKAKGNLCHKAVGRFTSARPWPVVGQQQCNCLLKQLKMAPTEGNSAKPHFVRYKILNVK